MPNMTNPAQKGDYGQDDDLSTGEGMFTSLAPQERAYKLGLVSKGRLAALKGKVKGKQDDEESE